MPNDQTNRGYLLPHPENIAFKDVVRIRTTIEKVDDDITKRENEHINLKEAFERFSFETFLNFWSNK
ncbi:hypothetical protein [Wolbachia endosymbiont of Folsomia candida]|uniref:hypothetical protein n=1 Tax=Wolbachia endosymbiont of Folsomia candida TaxID=169402 RepID=UPI000B015C94|nr:hypothetical protein [Wolbachia endosymbiont of Folsomia candida]APR97819.1 hypothetical protein ASM33_00505 [Wolbachia endosymbiont of Folsomia candida]APR99019.1 hypothetical protein ASM33_07485 [Wolbachia endosymbiont of Folsomia candida]